jgi:hypothetical protein
VNGTTTVSGTAYTTYLKVALTNDSGTYDEFIVKFGGQKVFDSGTITSSSSTVFSMLPYDGGKYSLQVLVHSKTDSQWYAQTIVVTLNK